MEKPHSFAGKVVHKFGKKSTNDYGQPDKFFADVADFLHLIDGIPYSAVEELEKYELNRDVIVTVIRRLYKILDAAKIDLIKEIERQDESPFDGLEEDLIKKPVIKISGEE